MAESRPSEKAKKGDFVEIEFTGKNKATGEIFDTNDIDEAKKINPKVEDTKPLLTCIGQGFIVKGFDEALEGAEVGKKKKISLTPEKAFGPRNPSLVRMIPMKIFTAQKVYPQAGMTIALDNALVKVINVSGGRVLVDFNNPLAGKEIEYEFVVKKIIMDTKEKVNALQNMLFGQAFEFDLDETGKTKKIIFKDAKLVQLLDIFKDKFKELLGMDLEILEKKEEAGKKAEEKKEEKK
jgi:FKBP-type peptidyl-prolyl cis-trans isomerase SlyD